MSEMSVEEVALAREYDLTEKMVPFLDRHLIYPLLESLDLIYDENTINKMKYSLLKDTNMVKFIRDKFEVLHPGELVPQDLVEKEKFVEAELQRLEAATKNTLAVLSSKEVQEELKQDKSYNLEYLQSKHGITESQINELYEFGQFQYNRGDYVMASDLLNNFKVLSTDKKMIASATWGKLALEITRCEWTDALKELNQLRDLVDSQNEDPLKQLYQRNWLIHWSLFPFFKSENGIDQLCDMFFWSGNLCVIQLTCPWILRYLAAAVIISQTNSKNRNSWRLKELIKIVNQEKYEYNDPLTLFIKALYIDFDFVELQDNLTKIVTLCKSDFFLQGVADVILNNARHLITEVYVRVHSKIDIANLLTSLNLSKEDGEKWIANLIRDSKLNAKIDESEGCIILNHETSSVYQTVIDKTKGLSFRSNQILMTALQKLE